MLILERETKRRNSAIRQLLWSDIDLCRETVRWRRETDKTGRESVTPSTKAAVDVLRALPRRVGSAPVFASKGRSRHAC
jgi:integrase